MLLVASFLVLSLLSAARLCDIEIEKSNVAPSSLFGITFITAI